jgi:hypothetical protein
MPVRSSRDSTRRSPTGLQEVFAAVDGPGAAADAILILLDRERG